MPVFSLYKRILLTEGKASLPVLLLSGLLAACSTSSEDRYVAQDVEVLYNLGHDRLELNQYKVAAAAFDEVERQHPYSQWARRAQVMAAYAHYEAGNYEDAVLSAQRFLQLHPGNPSAPYAYYLIALSEYERISDVGRDQKKTEDARSALIELIRRYPNSPYATDARLKLDLVNDHLAGKNMEVGRFYHRRKEYLSANLRYRRVVEDYETTSHAPEALHRLVETYLALGIFEEAMAAGSVLGHNYPDSKWYKYSYRLLAERGLEPGGQKPKGSGSFLGLF